MDTAILGSAIVDEVYYRFLTGERGSDLRVLLQQRGQIQRISKVGETGQGTVPPQGGQKRQRGGVFGRLKQPGAVQLGVQEALWVCSFGKVSDPVWLICCVYSLNAG